ncbi:MAG TPA: CusA/CzcA family heavy metal efflux RND transporter [Edaphocola sp.]|nr:CusA/CzcA family heavy metal efflux RND transporter [Edaphocola sp.]
MLNKIIAFSIKNKLIIGLFILGLIGYGSYQFTQLPIDAVPDITDNQVQIITIAPSFGATDIERLVTFPIEQANSNIPGMKQIRSFSRFGLSLVTIVFDDKTDVYWARQQVSERLQQLDIPKEIGIPEMGPVTTGLGEIYQYVVRPKKGFEHQYDATELRTIQDWIVRRQLLGVKGVAEVSSFGGKLKQYSIEVDPNKLQAYGITIPDVFEALENNNQNTGGAYIEKGPTVLYIRSEGLIGSIEDIQNIVIKNKNDGMPLFIRDIADINIGHAIRYGAMTYNDEGEVAGAVVMMLKGANSNVVIKDVKEQIDQIRKTLPEGVIIEPFLDRTKMVNNAISTVEKNLMEGALIVVFVLVIFLGNFRAGILVASVIPLSMLFAVIMMNAFGVSGNLMSLGALDFGLIVDGAVIIVEAVMHQLAHSKKFALTNKLQQNEMDEEVQKSSSKMMNSAVFGQIIILVVYLPILTLQGIEGKMFKPMAQTVAFALLGAFILSLTYIPMMSTIFLSKKIKHKANLSDRVMEKLSIKYRNVLAKVLKYPKTVIGTTLVLFATAVFTFTTLGGEFIPALEEGDFAVDTRVLPGSNLNTTIAYVSKAASILKSQFPEVEKVVTKIGSGEVPTDPMPMDASDMMVILKPKKEWTSAKTFNELSEKMGKALEDIPGITAGFQYPVQMRFNELMTGARQDVVVKIFGEDLDSLSKYAAHLAQIASAVKGTKDMYVEPVTGLPEIIIDYNRNTIAQYHMNISDINRVVNTAFAGQSSGMVYEGEKHFDLVLRLAGSKRNNLEDVQNLLIPTPSGSQVPLSQLALVSLKDGPNQIQREDAKRRIVIGFNIGDRDVQSIVNELEEKVNEQMQFSPGYYVTYGGAFQNLKAATNRLLIAVPLALLLIFVLLYFAFHSVKQGLLIYSAIPLSAIGGIFFLAIRGMPFSISAGVGFIALFGIAVLNGIVLIAEFNRLKNSGIDNTREIVLLGTKVRLRPVLMTAFVASLGFLPMALSNGAGAEVQRPLATVVIGGLMVATFLTLFVLPTLYILFETKKRPKMPHSKIISSFLVFALLTGLVNNNANAQKTIALEAAIDSAIKNNLTLKNENLKAEYQLKLTESANEIPMTTVSTEFGQISSSYTDSKFGISQSISFPTVYVRQKALLKQTYAGHKIAVAVQSAELKRQVTEMYIRLSYLQEKKKLLLKTDSLYSNFLQKANFRFEKGESNILEKATAENQQGQIALQLQQLQHDLEVAILQFQLLLNTATRYLPLPSSLKMDTYLKENENFFSEDNISMQFYKQQKQIAQSETQLQKSKLLPDLLVAYNNSSMIGTGADDKYYGAHQRFHSVALGLGIPLFYGAQKAKINASKINEQLANNSYDIAFQKLDLALKSALLSYKKAKESADWFEEKGLKSAATIAHTATIQFVNGDINYLEWVLLMNQSVAIESDYLEILKQLKESIAQINYLHQQ